MIAYSTNEPFVLEQLGAAYRTFSPTASGIDFYGDNLCTSEAVVKGRPDRVAAFRAASLKGWAYALAHKEATVDLILRSYSAKRSMEALIFRRSILKYWPDPTPPGSASMILRAGSSSPRPIGNSDC